MTTNERDRFALYERLGEVLGTDPAGTLMELLPPEGWDNIASKDDIKRSSAALQSDMTDMRVELKTDMVELRTELKTDMAELRTELKTDMVELRTELKTDIALLRGEFAELRGDVITAIAGLDLRMSDQNDAFNQRMDLLRRDVHSEMRQTQFVVIGLVVSIWVSLLLVRFLG